MKYKHFKNISSLPDHNIANGKCLRSNFTAADILERNSKLENIRIYRELEITFL